MSDPLYEVLKDLVVPGLAGVGGILVGIGAIVVASHSNALAELVRKDEADRDANAAHERYRDQLFRTVEPAVTGFLEHRAELNANQSFGSATERNLRSSATARLRLVHAVVNDDDARFIDATIHAYKQACDFKRWDVVTVVLGKMALALPALLTENHDVDALVTEAKTWVATAASRHNLAMPPAPSATSPASP